jgi:hypothetical protein
MNGMDYENDFLNLEIEMVFMNFQFFSFFFHKTEIRFFCRFFRTVEAFSLNAAAYVVVAWTVDRCRSCMVYQVEKETPDHSASRKPRHLTKLVIATWVLAILLSLQHVSSP